MRSSSSRKVIVVDLGWFKHFGLFDWEGVVYVSGRSDTQEEPLDSKLRYPTEKIQRFKIIKFAYIVGSFIFIIIRHYKFDV